MRNLTWRTRAMVSENQWVQLVQVESVRQIYKEVASRIVGREFVKLMSEQYGTLFDLLNRVGCDCGGGIGPSFPHLFLLVIIVMFL